MAASLPVRATVPSLPRRWPDPNVWVLHGATRARKERAMKRQRPDPLLPTGNRGEVTRELTGWDATMDEADVGDAGNGADPWGGDLTGGPPRSIEEPPDEPEDIL